MDKTINIIEDFVNGYIEYAIDNVTYKSYISSLYELETKLKEFTESKKHFTINEIIINVKSSLEMNIVERIISRYGTIVYKNTLICNDKTLCKRRYEYNDKKVENLARNLGIGVNKQPMHKYNESGIYVRKFKVDFPDFYEECTNDKKRPDPLDAFLPLEQEKIRESIRWLVEDPPFPQFSERVKPKKPNLKTRFRKWMIHLYFNLKD